jgi:glucokinase
MGNHKKRFTIGMDVGGTKILACLFDSHFKIVSETKIKTKPDRGERFFLKSLKAAVSHLLHDASVRPQEIIGLGVGCPGFIDPVKGVVQSSANIAFLNDFPLAKRLARLTGLPVTVGNDVQTGLYGEHQFGAARGYSHALGIFLGTGIGGALLLNGELYRGANGFAGEVGHLQIDPEGPLCGCGHRGCFEAYAGRLAISAEAAIAAARGKAPHLAQKVGTDLREIRSGALAKAVRAGDKVLEEVIDSKARLVGLVIANLVNLLNPSVVVLGGGLVEAMPQRIVKTAERVMRERALSSSARTVKVVAAKLGDYSIAIGAAKRAKDIYG